MQPPCPAVSSRTTSVQGDVHAHGHTLAHGPTGRAPCPAVPPGGDVAVVYMEAHDVEAALKGMGTSPEPFDRWFREHVRDVHGIAVEEGFPPPEQVLDYRG